MKCLPFSFLTKDLGSSVPTKGNHTNNLTHEKQEWINWANDKSDWIDPLINRPDELLDAE
jgi:hypothetical protein